MKMPTTVSLILTAGALLAVAPASLADDFAPPYWRGFGNTVMAEWEFASAPANPYFITPDTFAWVPEASLPLYDGFMTHAEVDNVANWTWVPGDGDGGLTPGTQDGAFLTFKVANIIDPYPYKILRMQVTYSGIPPVLADVFAFEGVVDSQSERFDGTLAGQSWWDLRFQPNPQWESLTLGVPFGTVIDQVVIDTWSYFPTPGTASLLVGVGGLFVGRRRRTA